MFRDRLYQYCLMLYVNNVYYYCVNRESYPYNWDAVQLVFSFELSPCRSSPHPPFFIFTFTVHTFIGNNNKLLPYPLYVLVHHSSFSMLFPHKLNKSYLRFHNPTHFAKCSVGRHCCHTYTQCIMGITASFWT